jgi:hypothetical protein
VDPASNVRLASALIMKPPRSYISVKASSSSHVMSAGKHAVATAGYYNAWHAKKVPTKSNHNSTINLD